MTLNDGNTIPQLGFGVFRVETVEAERVVADAIAVGYRHIDTAAIYDNEEGVGRGLRASGVPREELFITTKLWNTDHGDTRPFSAIDASLERLGLDYVDLYLVHWPAPPQGLYLHTWQAMEHIRESGKAISIGVSNFVEPYLQEIVDLGGLFPAVNQIEVHPSFRQEELQSLSRSLGIAVEAWSPLAGGAIEADEGDMGSLIERTGKSWAQLVLRWHLDAGRIVIPKSTHRERMIANLDVFDFELDDDAVATIEKIEHPGRRGGDPHTFIARRN
ncbi:MAG: aldo/keto reductase [Actinomycetota bacterium]